MGRAQPHERTVVVVQARLGSTRLPRKVLAPIGGLPLLSRVLERVNRIEGIDAICVAAASDVGDELASSMGVVPSASIVRGSDSDVLDRTLTAARETDADVIVRITSDCPLVDPLVASAVIAARRAANVPYARTAFGSGYPLGFDTEAITRQALEEAAVRATDPYEREHVTPYIWRRPNAFPAVYLDAVPDRRHWRLVVDTAEDLQLAQLIYEELLPINPHFGLLEIAALFDRRPELLAINADVVQNPYVPIGDAGHD